ncbi:hypothetical protein EYF80_060208 [Liparis tanakae]|uniref:Uncharacterized protein n=1 Tax=Liparis tanakae TaxID=230148 RepID=A0A4Z2EMP0_9TELE|nr:hypothetical protein EYF80_060208 [Liparis tanakae]
MGAGPIEERRRREASRCLERGAAPASRRLHLITHRRHVTPGTQSRGRRGDGSLVCWMDYWTADEPPLSSSARMQEPLQGGGPQTSGSSSHFRISIRETEVQLKELCGWSRASLQSNWLRTTTTELWG